MQHDASDGPRGDRSSRARDSARIFHGSSPDASLLDSIDADRRAVTDGVDPVTATRARTGRRTRCRSAHSSTRRRRGRTPWGSSTRPRARRRWGRRGHSRPRRPRPRGSRRRPTGARSRSSTPHPPGSDRVVGVGLAARRILERVHDTVREESGSVGDGTNDATALLREFETLHEAVKQPAPGRLTITYELYGDTFED